VAGTRDSRRWLLPVAAGLVSTIEFARVVAIVGQRITNSDAATLWYAADEWAHFRIHEPGFFGQSYGTNLMGIPIAIVHALGVPYPAATPLVLGASMLVLWFALSWAFAQRDHWVVATLAAAMPALLSAYYAVYVTSVTFERAFALVGVGAAILIARRSSVVLLGVGVALAGVGLAIDVSAALLVVPVAVWTALERRPTKREWVAVSIGGAVAGGYFVATNAFYLVHPENNLHGALPLQASLDLLGGSVDRLEPLFRLSTPELFRTYWIPITLGLVTVILLLATRRLVNVLPAVLCTLLVIMALSSPRAADSGGAFLTSGRLLLLFPAALTFLVFLLADTGRFDRVARLGLVVIALALVGSVLTRVLNEEHVPARLREQALVGFGYTFTDVDAVERQCRQLDRFAAAMDAHDAALTANGLLAIGCGPLVGSDLRTLDVPFDRRTWQLDRLASDPSTAAVFSSAGPGFCQVTRARFESCRRRGPLAVVRYAPQPLVNVLALLDMPLRPFGADCVIAGLRCSSGADAKDRFPLRRGRLSRAERIDVLASLQALNRGDASAGELDAHQTRRKAISRLLDRHPVEPLAAPYRTGPTTAAVELRIPGRDAPRRVLGQLVRVHGRWKVAATTECAIATARSIPCASGVPTLFPGLVWTS
jgi:hypothetical protein